MNDFQKNSKLWTLPRMRGGTTDGMGLQLWRDIKPHRWMGKTDKERVSAVKLKNYRDARRKGSNSSWWNSTSRIWWLITNLSNNDAEKEAIS